MAFDDECLSYVRKIEVAAEFGGDPDFTGFDPSMLGRRVFNVIRFPTAIKIEGDVRKEPGLICLYGEVIVRLILSQILGELALG